MKILIPVSLIFLLMLTGSVSADTLVFTEGFTSPANWTVVQPPSGLITNFNTGGSVDRRFRFRNGNGSMSSTLSERWIAIHKTSALAAIGEYDPLLDNSTLPVQWSFTFNNSFATASSASLAGVADGGFDAHGFVVAASSPDFQNSGNGYAVVVADGPDIGFQNTLQFVRYSGGLAGSFTTLLSWSAADSSDTGLENVGGSAVAVSLIFNPVTSEWTLQGSAGHASGFFDDFVDPLSVAYTSADTKSVVDNVFTGSSLGNIGMFLSTDESAPQVYLDNLTVQTIPESSTLLLVGLSLGALLLYRRSSR